MAWFSDTTSSTDTYRDYLTKIVAAATSQHVSAVVINSGGTGHAVGDVINVTHAGAILDLKVEVLTESAGVITSVLISSAGAFSNRIATVAVNAGGTGYAVGDIVNVQGGSATELGKAEVTSESGGVVTGVSVFETGGAYTTAPGLTGAASLGVGPAAFAGDDALTLDLTMTGLIGTSAIAQSGTTGSGVSATFDLTLLATGWDATERNTNNFTHNSLTDEKEVVLIGTVAGADDPIVAYRTSTETDGLDTRYCLSLWAMTAHNPTPSNPLHNNQGFGPRSDGIPTANSGAFVLVTETAAEPFYLSINGRRITGVLSTDFGSIVTQHSMYLGFGDPFGVATENPYPMVVMGSCNDQTLAVNTTNTTSLIECATIPSGNGPNYYRRITDGTYRNIRNQVNNSVFRDDVMYPLGEPNAIAPADGANMGKKRTLAASHTSNPLSFSKSNGNNTRSTPSRLLRPIPGGDEFVLYPATIIATPNSSTNDATTFIFGQLNNVFWFSGTDAAGAQVSNGDTFTTGAVRYRVFTTGNLNLRHLYWCMKEE